MKKIIAIVLLFWTMSSFANCNIKNIDANSKLDYANTVIDFLLQFNIDATLQKESSTTIDMLAAFKKTITEDSCALDNFRRFDITNKESIKNSNKLVEKYLQDDISYVQELIDILNGKYINDTTALNNRLAELTNYKRDELDVEESSLGLLLSMSTGFEHSDDIKVNMSKVGKDSVLNTIGITNKERADLLQRLSSINNATNSSKLGSKVLLYFYLFTKQISYENKKLTTLDAVNKYY